MAKAKSTKVKKKVSKKRDPELEKALNTFKKAMVDSDKMELDKIISDDVTYGHSDGLIESKADFVQNIHTGKYSFTTFDMSNIQVNMHGRTAIVRHTLDAETNDNNIPGRVNLFIMLIWRKQKSKWKLIGRQAVKNVPKFKIDNN